MAAKMTTHQRILHVMKRAGFLRTYVIQSRLRNLGCHISESSLTRRLREVRKLGWPLEMKRANKSGAACVYRLTPRKDAI